MTPSELRNYIDIRNGELCADEILTVLDKIQSSDIDHIEYHSGQWEMWNPHGDYYTFRKREW